jgi:CBS domain containing-hemolysin-like protein
VLFSTFVQMIFGELFPKNLAITRPEPVARWLAWSTTLYLKVFGWLIWLFDQSSNLLLRALRIEPVHDVEHSATPRDLEHIVAESRNAGELPPELSVLLDRILDFPTGTAEHAMIPRAHVDTVRVEEPVSSVLARMATGHTRYPVVGESSDDLHGVIHLHDLLDTEPAGTAGTLCRPPVIVPASLPLPQVLVQLNDAKDEMALVIDEYGGFAGIVTVEDIAEELVGEIADEHDQDAAAPAAGSDADGWELPGELHLDEVERLLGHRLPDGDYETLAGLVITRFGGLPALGDTVSIALAPDAAGLVAEGDPPHRDLTAEVREVDKRVPSSVFVTVHIRREESGDE